MSLIVSDRDLRISRYRSLKKETFGNRNIHLQKEYQFHAEKS